MLYTYTHKAKHEKDIYKKHIAQQSYIQYAQMMITTTTIHTQCANVDYNLSQMVKTMSFQITLKVDSASLCLRSNGRSFHVAGP